MQSLFLMTLFVLQSTLSLAQNRTVTGVVVDEKDEPIIGANVTVKGTSKGTITDLDGKFVISAPANAKLLEVSFIGYNTQTVTITGKTLQIKLTESAIALDEVVAIGYGSAKKGNVTGAIAKVNAEKLEDRATTNIASSLQGQLAGVEVRSTTGEPGSELQIRVRGAASINADATPLYVVDGIPVDDLGSLNPGDIQSIEVLKDASSSAIYGSRGANGVVLITTKQASADDKVKVQFQASFGIQSLERKVDVLSPEEWIEFRTAYNNNRYISQYGSKGATIEDDYATRLAMIGGKESYYFLNDPRWTEPGYGNLQLIDWQDEFFRLAPIQNYQLSLSSGRGNTKYRVSLGYTDQKGIAIESSYKRLNFRANVESKLFNRITVGVNLAPSANWSDGGRVDGKDRQATNVLTMVPVAEPEDGIYTGSGSKGYYRWTSSSKVSPIAYMEEVTNHGESVRFNSAAYVKADIWDGLKAEVTGSYNFSSTQSRSFIPSSVTKYRTDSEGYKTTASRSEARSNKFLLQTILHYNKTFGRHTVGAMAGYSMESSGGSSSKLSATQFPDNSLEVFDMADVVLTAAAASLSTPSRLMSYFGRVQYEYDDRYLLTASIRRDGSSRFGKENRWGVFPAVSAAYRISNEKFWPKDFFMNSLKIRGSWGANGNNSIPTNTALAKLSSANYSSGNIINGFAPTSLANPDLGWEKTESWNIAFDMGMFNNRIFLSADYYVKTTKDLLAEVPGISGTVPGIGNLGSIENKGVELAINWRDQIGDWGYNVGANLTTIKNKVLSLVQDGYSIIAGDKSQSYTMAGYPIGYFYGYKVEGVYQTDEEIARSPKNTLATVTPGDLKFKDVNGDGEITTADRTMIGDPTPDVTYGITLGVNYKNWELGIDMMGQGGNQIFRTWDNYNWSQFNFMEQRMDRWHGPGTSNTQPLLNTKHTINNMNSEYYIEDGSFFRIRNVQLAYNFDKTLISRIGMQALKLYVNIQNLKTWKHNTGYTPELGGTAIAFGVDDGSYPMPAIYTFGFNLTF